MLTDKKMVLVACSNVPKRMGSDRGRQVPVDDSPPQEFRNHLAGWLAMMTETAGVAALVPEIASPPSKSDSDGGAAGTTTADGPRTTRRGVAEKISRS
jgi:hypothetical protein